MAKRFKKVLVTGGAGCIGMQVCRELHKRGISVYLFDLPEQILRVKRFIPKGVHIYYGSILDCSSLRDAILGCDAVAHLAGYLGVRRTELNKLRCIEININGTKNVLDCALQQGVKKVVFASSSEVYGEPSKNPITEEATTQGKTVYAVSKLAAEELCKAYHQRYPRLSYTILRYFNTFGPFQAAQFVIPRFIKNAMEGRPPEIYGDGKQMRSYCYASDTAWATVEALQTAKADNQILNVGNSRNPISLSDLARTIIRLCAKNKKIAPRYKRAFKHTDRTRQREIFQRYCDTKKAEKILKFTPKVSLAQGIKKVVAHGDLFSKWPTTDFIYSME
ncbi:NAD-dependent epimerase/dehydratase family protein [Candidatus Omnitrophota bacterium]